MRVRSRHEPSWRDGGRAVPRITYAAAKNGRQQVHKVRPTVLDGYGVVPCGIRIGAVCDYCCLQLDCSGVCSRREHRYLRFAHVVGCRGRRKVAEVPICQAVPTRRQCIVTA